MIDGSCENKIVNWNWQYVKTKLSFKHYHWLVWSRAPRDFNKMSFASLYFFVCFGYRKSITTHSVLTLQIHSKLFG